MNAAKEAAEPNAAGKKSRNKKTAKESRREHHTQASTATAKVGIKSASKKRPVAPLAPKGLSSTVEAPLPEAITAEPIGVETTATEGHRQTDTTQGAQASKKIRGKGRKKDGDKRGHQGVVPDCQQPASQPIADVCSSLQPGFHGPREVRVPPEGQTTQPPIGNDKESPEGARIFHRADDHRKSSAAALSQLIGEAELSGDLSGEILGQAPVAVSIMPISSPYDVPGSSLMSPALVTPGERTQYIGEAKTSALTDGITHGISKSAISEHSDFATRSDRRRSTLIKPHSAIAERALRDRRGSIMQPKSEVPNKACIPVCVVAFASGALLLVLVLNKKPGTIKGTVCDTPACVVFSRKMQESLNTSEEPCRNFAQFVCGGWSQRHDLSVAQEALVEALSSMGNSLSDLRVPTSGTQDAKLKAHIFYRSCYSVLKGERDELDNVRKALLEVGVVWPHVSPGPNVLNAIIRSSLALHWGTPFEVSLRQDASGELVVVLDPFKMFGHVRDKFGKTSRDRRGREAYFETLRSSFKQSDANLLDFDTVNGLDEDAFSSFPQNVEVSSDLVTLDTKNASEGVEYITSEVLREALNPYSPVKNPSRIAVMTHSEAFLRKFLELWSKYGKQKTHIFVSWCIVQIAALYANQKLQLNFYGTEDRAVLIQGSLCLAKAFLIARSQIFTGYTDDLLASSSRFFVHRLTLTVHQAFEQRLRRWKGFDANVTVLRKSSNMEAVQHVLHAGLVPEGNDTVADMQDSLVHNWRNAPVLATEAEPVQDVYAAIEAGKLFVTRKQDFMLLPYAFALPYFNEGFTAALNYAGVGGLASFAMANVFIEAYSEPTDVNPYLQAALDCISNFSVNAQDEAVAKLVVLHVLAAQTSYDAYERRLSLQDKPVTGFESFSPQQMFFIASCYRLCVGGGQTAPLVLCNEYLQHVDRFAHAFSCAESSRMNPPTKCSLL